MKKPEKTTFHVGIGQLSYAVLARTVSGAVRQAAKLVKDKKGQRRDQSRLTQRTFRVRTWDKITVEIAS